MEAPFEEHLGNACQVFATEALAHGSIDDEKQAQALADVLHEINFVQKAGVKTTQQLVSQFLDNYRATELGKHEIYGIEKIRDKKLLGKNSLDTIREKIRPDRSYVRHHWVHAIEGTIRKCERVAGLLKRLYNQVS